MDVGGYRAADCESICAGLFLPDAPIGVFSVGTREVAAHDVRPGNPGLDLQFLMAEYAERCAGALGRSARDVANACDSTYGFIEVLVA
jgi:hypothetical protein